ncbi:TonB-dependent receptor domain-containing protein [Sphingobium sp. SCG-1]|uniref:TonB-dependent receptor domain-containing protein n=1 Tax=Sphingobium sp. SCG-1 TaxID=2072936 RepID=UPI0016709C67|nr:TonB-dependent receptor [Sphingobium sp. SCG-1]
MACAFALALVDAAVQTSSAQAREAVYDLEIPASSLNAALSRFSEQTGSSVGIAGKMPRATTRRIKGRMTAEAALRGLLAGTGLRARRVGSVYRIERAEAATVIRPEMVDRVEPPVMQPVDIVVTAQKRRENLADIPLSIAIVQFGPFSSGAMTPSNRDVGFSIEGLATTNLGPGRNRQFIRGVADSPFNGQSQSTVAVQIDDARATFDAPNPDLRLIDMDQVEVLKGPQGPLYGSGAIGGIYHIVTRKPVIDEASGWLRMSAEGVEHGGVTGSLEGVMNMPLIPGRLALRGSAYRVVEPGWIDNADGRENSNSTKISGSRLALRWIPSEDWLLDAGMSWQDIDARDSQYIISGREDLTRDSRIAEPTDNDFKMGHVTVEGALGNLRFVSASSIVNQGYEYILDASDSAAYFGLEGFARFQDSRAYAVLNQEFRLSNETGQDWLIGASLLRATSKGRSIVSDESGVSRTVETLDRRTTELAVFGEFSRQLAGRLRATLGARLIRTVSRDLTTELEARAKRMLVSPSASLSLPLDEAGIIYLRYARAKRPGGLAASDAEVSGQYAADKVNTLDLGFRRSGSDGRLSLSGSIYHTRWDRVQSDYLLPNGLVSTRNAGRGAIYGLEADLDWKLGAGIDIAAGTSVQRARLVRADDGSHLKGVALPVVPDLSFRLTASKALAIKGWRGRIAARANYVGSASLSFDDALNRPMGNYAVLSSDLYLDKGPWTVAVRLDNALDIRGDSFSFGNPFSIRTQNQLTPLRPRGLEVAITRRW